MNGNRTDVIVVCFELMYAFECVVVVNTDEHVVLEEKEQ